MLKLEIWENLYSARENFLAVMHVIYYCSSIVAYTFVSRNSCFYACILFCNMVLWQTLECSTVKHGCTYLEEISVRVVLLCVS